MDYLKEFVDELLESRRIDRELEKGSIKHNGEEYQEVTREEGKGKSYKHGTQGSKYFFVKGEDVFKLSDSFFDNSITKLVKEYKEGTLTASKLKSAVLNKVNEKGESFEKELNKLGVDKFNPFIQALQFNSYFLVDCIFEIIVGKVENVKECFEEVLKASDDLRKHKRTSTENKLIFDTFIKHFKIVEKLIDIVLDHGGKEVIKTIERYEAKENM